MLQGLRRLFGGPVPDLGTLERRVSALEAERVTLLAEWTSYQDMFSRYLKRLSQRARRDNGDAGVDPISAAILERRGALHREE